MKIQDEIETAVRGAASDAVIYWDRQDPANIGPAYRCGDESGSLIHTGWRTTSGGELTADDTLGYNISDYFRRNGEYQGPDQDGIYPILEAV